MSKRLKVRASHTSLRLAPDVAERLDKIAGATGWSVARSVAHFIRTGFAAADKDHRTLAVLVNTFDGATTLHKVELDNARRLADVRKSLKGLGAPGEPLRHSPARVAAAKLVKVGRAKRPPRASLPPVPPAKPDSAA